MDIFHIADDHICMKHVQLQLLANGRTARAEDEENVGESTFTMVVSPQVHNE